MKKHLFIIIISILTISCKEEPKAKIAVSDSNNTNENYIDLIGKKLEYNYGENIYLVSFKTNKKLHWKCIQGEEKGKEATETYATQRLNNNTLFISWIEKEGLGVSQVINLKEKSIHTFLKIDRKIVTLSGTIRQL
jgi:phenolic acid decarboxylase